MYDSNDVRNVRQRHPPIRSLRDCNTYQHHHFNHHFKQTKINIIAELVKCKQGGISVAAYGAAAKGNTLLNYSGIDSDLIQYVIDLNPHKQGKYLPGSRIPILGADELIENAPDVLLVLPWNLADEIKVQLNAFTKRGMRLLRAVPDLEYF